MCMCEREGGCGRDDGTSTQREGTGVLGSTKESRGSMIPLLTT